MLPRGCTGPGSTWLPQLAGSLETSRALLPALAFRSLKSQPGGSLPVPGYPCASQAPGLLLPLPGACLQFAVTRRHSLSCSFGLKRHSGHNPPLREVWQVCLVAHGPDDLPCHVFPNAFSNPELARWQMGRVTMLVPRAPSLPAPGFNTALMCGRPSGPRASHTQAAAESRCHCSTVAPEAENPCAACGASGQTPPAALSFLGFVLSERQDCVTTAEVAGHLF